MSYRIMGKCPKVCLSAAVFFYNMSGSSYHIIVSSPIPQLVSGG